jgi:4-amino-4-deoxy-L-arabinose transferase-like glycosyltransferase
VSDEDGGRGRGEASNRRSPRWLRLWLALAGVVVLWLGLAAPVGPLGRWLAVGLGLALSVVGLLHALGAFDDGSTVRTARRLERPLAAVVAAALVFVGTMRLAVAGTLPAPWFFVTVAFLGCLAALAWLSGVEDARSAWKRHGLVLSTLVTLLYLPTLGSHGLLDPWETHYGEVSREILARGDWISLWWADDGWFFSKPALSFWLQAAAMSLFGVKAEPGQMLAPADGATPAPEWAVRFPMFALALFAIWILYRTCARFFGRRAGLLAGIALATMPQWALVARQTMTDLPFVATMTASIACVLLAFGESEGREMRTQRVSVLGLSVDLSLRVLVLGLVIALVLPQIVYLASREVSLTSAAGAGLRIPRVTGDVFFSGSPGNCGEWPGIPPCKQELPHFVRARPSLQALLWAQGLALFLAWTWQERRAGRLLFVLASVFAALSTLAKGPAGLVFPVVVAAAFVFARRRLALLASMGLHQCALVFVIIVAPWFVAMTVRHGWAFPERLLLHDMFKRAFEHVHDTNQGEDVSVRYYVWQLGYAVFPWVVLLPSTFARLRWFSWSSMSSRRVVEQVLVIWAIASFALFSYMQTKFHHYVLPVLPPLAALVGVAASRWERDRLGDRREATVLVASGLLVLGFVVRDLVDRDGPASARLLHLFSYDYGRAWPASLDYRRWFLGFGLAAAVCAVAWCVGVPRRTSWLRGRTFPVVSLAFTAFTLWRYLPEAASHYGQRELVLRYHEARRDTPGPLVAYQMNWKGESFYTGSQLAIFIDSGKSFRDWVLERRRRGERTVYVLLPTPRLASVRAELKGARSVEVLSTEADNNKFSLLRVVH